MAEGVANGLPLRPDTDLYALLHVSKEATGDEITQAYRHWAQVYHPDKYQSPQMKHIATLNFQRIRTAYDILTDGARRALYDVYGLEGATSGLEVGPHLGALDDIRAQLEKLQQRKRELKQSARTNLQVSLLVSTTLAETLADIRQPPRITGMQMSAQCQAPLSDLDLFIPGATMVSRRGIGAGNVLGVYRRQMSPEQSFEVLTMAGLRPLVSVATTRQLTSHVSATWGASYNFREQTVQINNSWSRQLSEHWTGNLNWSVGPEGGGTAVGWQYNSMKNSGGVGLKLGESSFGVHSSFVRRFSDKSQGRVSLRLGTGGVDVDIGGTRRISENSTGGLSCIIGLQGILWKLKFNRGGFKVTVPILLSPTLHPGILAGALLLPSVTIYALKKYVIKPYQLKRRRRKEYELRSMNAQKVKEAKEEAARAQELLAAPAARKQRRQEEGSGLVVTAAVYGNLEGGERTDDARRLREQQGLPDPYLDVRLPLQFLVDDSGYLHLHEGVRKRGLMGFCDPCPGETKKLRVLYTWRGFAHQVVVGDAEELMIPQDSHRMPGQVVPDSVHHVD